MLTIHAPGRPARSHQPGAPPAQAAARIGDQAGGDQAGGATPGTAEVGIAKAGIARAGSPGADIAQAGGAGAGDVWLDLLQPDEAEVSEAQRLCGLRVPSRGEIAEIESSSRLRREGGALYLSTTIVSRPDTEPPMATPLGLVLSPTRLLTLRFSRLASFDSFGASFAEGPPGACSTEAFLGLMEAIVDRAADILERVGSELDAISHAIFHPDEPPPRRMSGRDQRLREALRGVGLTGDLVSRLRDSLLGFGRIVAFVSENASEWIPERLRGRFTSLRQDIASLSDYDTQLTNKVQFLLDATLGFLNIEQNNGIKVLTVVSLVGIPPTLIASIYGMNFKDMPELNWTYGYPYALGLIVLSVVGPLLFFRLRGWL